jgi:hypothetical protein
MKIETPVAAMPINELPMPPSRSLVKTATFIAEHLTSSNTKDDRCPERPRWEDLEE